MTKLRSLLIGSSIAALATTAAVAQTPTTPPDTPPNAPATAPAAQGVQMPAPAPARTPPPPRQTLTAPTPPDPLVQKRDADARADAEYHDAKKASKAQYQQQMKNATINRAADRRAAANQLKTDSQSGNGTQVPDDETKH